jgi:hypothetical protein
VTGDAPDAHAIGEGAHAIELARHIGADGLTPWAGLATQSHVQHGAFFGGVDHIATEHGIALPGNTGLLGQSQQRDFDVWREALAAGVKREADGAGGHALGATSVRFQGVTQVRLRRCGKLCEGFPGRKGGGRNV